MSRGRGRAGMGRSWGRVPRTTEDVLPLAFASDPLPLPRDGRTVLPHGLGRSYGDSCLNDGHVLLHTPRMDHLLAFDPATGVLRCEAGVSLATILRVFVPRGWFLPVTPGTKFVTVGGAIANDVHGKNHHKAGTFGCHVPRFELLRSDGSRRVCSPTENADLYRATIGGLGLTGLVTWAEVRLRPVPGPFIDAESIRTETLDAFFDLSAASERTHDYTVTWIDSLARGRALGRGLFLQGNHAERAPAGARDKGPSEERIPFPVDLPGFVLNPLTVKAFNALYSRKQLAGRVARTMHYDPFFYPLDAIRDWNRMYGRRGFFQYQCWVPFADGPEAVRGILDESAKARQASFLTVLKTFGDVPSPGMLSFPRRGVTVALDYPNRGAKTLDLLERLDALVRKAGGMVYPAKDARMSPQSFQAYYPGWKEFSQHVDPKFSSSFWRRVAGTG